MAIVVFQHDALEHAGRLGDILRDEGHRLRVIKLHEGDSVPVDLDDVDGVISMGGTMDVGEEDKHPWMKPELDFIKQAVDAKVPFVGVCLGAQFLAAACGGEVGKMEDGAEIGWAPIESSFFGTIDPILAGIPWHWTVLHLHGCEVKKAPPGGTPLPLQSSDRCKIQCFRVGFNAYGIQHHFELDRRSITALIEDGRDWIRDNGGDADAILKQADEVYPLWRHLGDRLCRNLATLVFPLDKRKSA